MSKSLAEQVVARMRADERFPHEIGVELLEIKEGYAKTEMVVTKAMLNGHQSCHGGVLFSFADTAFAYACNSYNFKTISSSCSIDFLAPGFEGDRLVAEAVERNRTRKTGVYDVTITNQDGKVIALFRGNSYQIPGEVLE